MGRSVSRRRFLKGVGGGVAAMSLGPLGWSAQLPDVIPGEGKPNVLFIAIDDLNDWTGCLGGHPDVKTPRIDELASRGVLFRNAHCNAPLCNASRASLLTGIRPSTSGVYVNPQPWRKSPVLKDAVTLPQHFMAHGYRVMGSGKIFHGRYPDPPSWHEYWPAKDKNRPGDPRPSGRPLNGIPKTRHFDWGPVDVPDEEMGDWKVTDWVCEQLSKGYDRPFFLGCGIFRPHLPWYVPPKYFEQYPLDEVTLPNVNENDLDDVPKIGRQIARQHDHRAVTEHDQWRAAVRGYLASISFCDTCVGRVIDTLDRSPHADDTIVVLWSDHGWHLGEKLHWRKFALWEEATHNPMAFVVPGLTDRRGRCDEAVELLDIYPTLTELCGLQPREELEGISLVPQLEDPAAERERPAVTTFHWNNHSVRDERWRYISYHVGSEELYDHSKDELEWENLAGRPEYRDVKEELARWLPEKNAPSIPRDR